MLAILIRLTSNVFIYRKINLETVCDRIIILFERKIQVTVTANTFVSVFSYQVNLYLQALRGCPLSCERPVYCVVIWCWLREGDIACLVWLIQLSGHILLREIPELRPGMLGIHFERTWVSCMEGVTRIEYEYEFSYIKPEKIYDLYYFKQIRPLRIENIFVIYKWNINYKEMDIV